MGDTVRKDGTHLTAGILTEGHLLSCVCQLDALRVLRPALTPSSLLLPCSLCVFPWWLIGRSRLRCHPARRAQTLVTMLSGRLFWFGMGVLGGLVSLHTETLHSIPKMLLLLRFRGGRWAGCWKSLPKQKKIKLEAFKQCSGSRKWECCS